MAALPDNFVRIEQRALRGAVRADLVAAAVDWFAAGEPLPGARGRGGVGVLRLGDLRAVVRPYRRGGALRAVLPRHFADPERPLRELRALMALRQRGVPVVEPLAALARRRGALWELRLATVLVDGALPLPAFAAADPARRRRAVRAAGALVAAAFAAGLRHRDLHPDNIVVRAAGADVQAWLLDFDRAVVGAEPAGEGERDAMLARMGRYLVRHRGRLPASPSGGDVARFLAGMGLDRAARRATMARVAERLRQQVRRHRLAWRRGGGGGT